MLKIIKKRKYFSAILLLFFFCLFCIGSRPVLASENANQILSLEQAVSRAVKNSETVKRAAKEVERTEEIRNYRYKKLQGLSTAPAFTAAAEVPRSQLLSSDLEWRMSKKSLTAEEDRVVLDTCNKYWNVLKAEKELERAEVALNSALKQLQVAQAGERVGISLVPAMSPGQLLLSCEAQYKAAQASLAAAENDLGTAYMALNQMIRLPVDESPVLSDELIYEKLEVDNLDFEVARVLENHPQVWNAEEAVTLQEYLKNMMFYTGEYQPYEARQIPVEQAQLDAANLKKLCKEATRSSYYAVKNLEESYEALQESLKASEEDLRVKSLMFELGMVTAAEVAAEEQKVARARSDAFAILCQHAYAKLAFQKPWAIS
jgi:outer membrane protein TolC